MIFSIVLTSCNSNNIVDSSHKNMSFREAKDQGYVAAGPSGLANVDRLEEFFEGYQNKKKSSITIAQYTDEGDPIYVDLKYDGKEILYTYDNSWDSFGGQNRGVQFTSCSQMGKRTGPRGDSYGTEYYLTSCKDYIGYSNQEKQEYFLLFVEHDNEK